MPQMSVSSRKVFLNLWAAGVLLGGVVVMPIEAAAVSARVKMACANDYFAYCSKFAPDTPEVRACMDSNGANLSKRCVNALVAEGEVSAKEVAERADDANE